MKFLGWMHRKLRDNTIEPLKDLSLGNYCTCLSARKLHEEQDSPVKPDLVSPYVKPDYYEISVDEIPEDLFFHGFLAIGTLGSSEVPANAEPPTPTFAISLDDVTEKVPNEAITPEDLKLINEELEKFIEAESEEEAFSRNSFVSTVALCEAPVCPLQGYLFGSTVELPETREASTKKNRKVSLGQLFKETKREDKAPMEKPDIGEVPRKAVERSSKGIVKKVLRKLGASSRGSGDGPDGSVGNPVAAKKKLQKVLRMFHRKIHPENPEAAKEWKPEEVYTGHKKKNAELYADCLDESEGHWIKTDTEYLVLEL